MNDYPPHTASRAQPPMTRLPAAYAPEQLLDLNRHEDMALSREWSLGGGGRVRSQGIVRDRGHECYRLSLRA